MKKDTKQVPQFNGFQEEYKYYCTNANLLHEMFKWRNSSRGLPVYKLQNGRLVLTKKTDDESGHEKYKRGTRYFIKFPKTHPRYSKERPIGFKYYRQTSKEVVEEVTQFVKDDNYAFDIDENPLERTMSNDFGKMMMLIAQKVSNHSFFRNYPLELKQEMAAYAYEKIIKGLWNFKFKYTNAFAYITQAVFNSYKSILSAHYKQVNIKRALTKRAMIDINQINAGSSMGKCLNKQFQGNDFDDFSEY